MTQSAEQRLRIGDVAQAAGVTARTVRYYEELGLLGGSDARGDRAKGSHRLFSDADVERLRELIRLRDLLGLSLEELTELAEAAELQRYLRNQWAASTGDDERADIVRAGIPNVQRQLDLVRTRQRHLAEFADELAQKLERMQAILAELEHAQPTTTGRR
jgi:DNA-binding transcriptional MerR regulator